MHLLAIRTERAHLGARRRSSSCSTGSSAATSTIRSTMSTPCSSSRGQPGDRRAADNVFDAARRRRRRTFRSGQTADADRAGEAQPSSRRPAATSRMRQRLRDSGIGGTNPQPACSCEHVRHGRVRAEQQLISVAAPDQGITFINVRDAGAVGARCLVGAAPHAAEPYGFTGGSPTSQFAEAFSQLLAEEGQLCAGDAQTERSDGPRTRPARSLVTHMLTVTKGVEDSAFSREI